MKCQGSAEYVATIGLRVSHKAINLSSLQILRIDRAGVMDDIISEIPVLVDSERCICCGLNLFLVQNF